MRVESVTIIMPQEVYNQLLMQQGGKYAWETMINPDLKISDLDENAVFGAVRAGINSGRLPEVTIREEELSVPYKALRECCINSFSHRTYDHRGNSVSIAIYDDRIQITNTGSFLIGMSLDNILESGDSKPQNPIIANVLYKSKVLENWGRGISLMVNECRRVGLPDPEFHTDGGFVSVVFRYQNKTVGQATDQVTDQVTDQATDQVYSLIKAINTKTLSVKDIMTDLGLRHRPTFRTNYLHPALDTGCIVALFPDQPNHPKQKYHLTEKGLALLNKK